MVHWDSVPNLIYTPAGTLRDTLGEFSGMDIYATPERAGSLLFGRYTHAQVHGDELYITDGGDYEYRVYGLPDGLLRIVRVRRERRALTAEDETGLRDFYMARARDADGERRITEYPAESPRAKTKPWLSDHIVDDLGNVWVEQYQPRWDETARAWEAFGPDGSWLDETELPAGLDVVQIGSDFVLGIWRDEVDVAHVRVYAVSS